MFLSKRCENEARQNSDGKQVSIDEKHNRGLATAEYYDSIKYVPSTIKFCFPTEGNETSELKPPAYILVSLLCMGETRFMISPLVDHG